MSVVEGGGSAGTGLVARVKGILLTPSTEWDRIEREPATVGGLFAGYVCILAAIPAAAGLIGGQVFGHGIPGFSFKPSIGAAITLAVVGYVGSLVMTFVLGVVIDALAPSFGAEKNRVQAFKVAAYSGTAGWVAGVFQLIPILGVLAILGSLYGCFLLYLGLPRVMKAPADKAPGYAIVTIVVAIVIAIVIGVVTTAIGGVAGLSSLNAMTHADKASGTVEINGSKVDLGRMQAAAERAEQLSKNPGKAASPEALKALLPASAAGYSRASVETSSSGTDQASIVVATGQYEKPDGTAFRLEITDLGPMAGLTALAAGMNGQATKETASGYEKTQTIDGRLTTEEWDRDSKSGKYSVVFGDRFSVQADGSAASIDDLKQAVRAVDGGRLEAMAK
ncbi:Yip1 family protein [Caulobacter segnis]|uniref:Yip1 family protein n=1 Tax=Caulobacter segnis TaxID=88688 RepID=UPI001CBD09B3|nr:Yip1 family protein [Caulobacter segnis]UAL11388.1 YIP1 family protein [Caulobacter segnis]